MKSPSAQYMNLPFAEAIAFFRRKLSIATERWTDLWQGMHARAFTVAGAMKTQLLSDLRGAVDKAIAKGTTLAEFRQDFDRIVASHGWDYKGGRNWRSRVIYQTNVSTAYHAGHYRQMTDPAVLSALPYWRYLASSSSDPRPEHMGWYNLVLRHDDPFWQTHYPPNGWGCKCGVASLSARQAESLDAEMAGTKHPVRREAPPVETYEWTDKLTGKTRQVPVGIDPGWAYNVGEAAWGRRLSADAMDAWGAKGATAWERLTPGDWQSAARPERIPVDSPRAEVGHALQGAAAIAENLQRMLGGEETVFSFGRGPMRFDTLVNAETLARHIADESTTFLPFLPELLADPAEVWMGFERHLATGKMALRQRIVKAARTDDGVLLLSAQALDGMLETVTMTAGDATAINSQRVGKLIYTRGKEGGL